MPSGLGKEWGHFLKYNSIAFIWIDFQFLSVRNWNPNKFKNPQWKYFKMVKNQTREQEKLNPIYYYFIFDILSHTFAITSNNIYLHE